MFNPDFDPLAILEECQKNNLTLLNNQQVLMRTVNNQQANIHHILEQQKQLREIIELQRQHILLIESRIEDKIRNDSTRP